MIFDPRLRTGRIILASLFILLLGIGACSIPSSYEAEVGQAVKITLNDGNQRSDANLDEILTAIQTLPGVQNISVNEKICGDVVELNIMLWGEDIDPDLIQSTISEQFPELADAEICTEPLESSVDCCLGDRLLQEVFEIDVIEGSDAESIRQQILEQMAAQGHEGDAVVEMIEEDGQVRIEIEVMSEEPCGP